MTTSRRFARVYWSVAAATAALWVAFARLVMPPLIRQGYAGRSIRFINDAFGGRDVHPVEHYLTDWAALSTRLTILWGVAALGGFLAWVYRAPLGRVLGRITLGEQRVFLHRWEALLLAFMFGMLDGYAEATGAIGKAWVKGMPHYGVAYSAEVVWMSPLANGLLYVAAAGILLLVTLWSRRGVPLHGITLLFVTTAVFATSTSLRIGLHPAAVLALGLGAAVQTARWGDRRPESFRRVVRRLPPALACLLLGTAAVMGWINRARLPATGADAGRPNILLIILDTVRRPNLSLYGHTRPTTPFLESIAPRSAVFDAAVATAPWTLPSHASMFTGRYPYELRADWEARLDGTFPTLAEVLSDHGYRTGGFVANTIFAGARTGLDRGFLYYDDHPINLPMLISNSWIARKLVSRVTGQLQMPWGTWGRKHAEEVNRSFLRWLDGTGERPFFAFLNYLDAHHPYHVHEPFASRFSGPLPPARLAWDNHYSLQELENFKLAYDNAIAYLDAEIDSLFHSLQARDLLRNTIVLIASDHGEQFGEQAQDAYGHGNSLYASSLEVPLIIYAPNLGVPGTRIRRTVTMRDLPATIMAMVGLADQSPLPGESLARLWTTDSVGGGFAGASPVLSELSLTKGFGKLVPPFQGHSRSITEGPFQYIANGDGTEELYNTDGDPWERDDLISHGPTLQVLGQLRDRLRAVPMTGTAPAVAVRDH